MIFANLIFDPINPEFTSHLTLIEAMYIVYFCNFMQLVQLYDEWIMRLFRERSENIKSRTNPGQRVESRTRPGDKGLSGENPGWMATLPTSRNRSILATSFSTQSLAPVLEAKYI